MPVQVRIPTPLRSLTGNRSRVSAVGKDVREVLEDLERRYPGFREGVYDQDGSLKRFMNVYVNGDEIRFLKGEDTTVKEGDEVSIIPAIAGGISNSHQVPPV